MLNQQVTLTKSTLLNLIERGGAEPHTVLASTPTWRSAEVRRAEHERANRELERLGLISPRGIDPALRSALETLARPTLEYYAWLQSERDGQDVSYTLLAGNAGMESVLLARNMEHNAVALLPTRREELLNHFLAQIPPHSPGKGQPLAVPKSALSGNRGSNRAGSGVMRSVAPDAEGRAAAELSRILSLRRTGGGNLYVATRNYAGGRNRCERPVNYIDTVEGRWIAEERPGSPEPLVALTPATPQLLGDRLRATQSQLPT